MLPSPQQRTWRLKMHRSSRAQGRGPGFANCEIVGTAKSKVDFAPQQPDGGRAIRELLCDHFRRAVSRRVIHYQDLCGHNAGSAGKLDQKGTADTGVAGLWC